MTIRDKAAKIVADSQQMLFTPEDVTDILASAMEKQINHTCAWMKNNWHNYIYADKEGVMGPPIIVIDEDMDFASDLKQAMSEF